MNAYIFYEAFVSFFVHLFDSMAKREWNPFNWNIHGRHRVSKCKKGREENGRTNKRVVGWNGCDVYIRQYQMRNSFLKFHLLCFALKRHVGYQSLHHHHPHHQRATKWKTACARDLREKKWRQKVTTNRVNENAFQSLLNGGVLYTLHSHVTHIHEAGRENGLLKRTIHAKS